VDALDRALTAPEFLADPYAVYARLRAEGPVHWCEPWGQWVITRHDDVLALLRDHRRFSSAGFEQRFVGRLGGEERAALPDLLRHYSTPLISNTDPPVHTRMRRLVARSFVPRVLDPLRERIEELVEALLDRAAARGRMDAIADFAYPLPAIVIGELLGAPAEAGVDFLRWSADIVAFVGSGRVDLDLAVRADRSLREFREFLEPRLERRRRRPADDLLGLLAAGDGERLSEGEIVATCVNLLFAGHETTANLIGNGLLALFRHPAELARLRDDPGLAAAAVEELLRYDGPVQRVRRVVTEDVEMSGAVLRAGDLAAGFIGSGNRDPARFEEPDLLDLTRAGNQHLAFGYGIHFCVGAALSRLEAPIALNALLRRFPRVRPADAEVVWKRNVVFRGLEVLKVELD
jgi:cytochrome P450